MIFTETSLEGAFIIELDPHHDERGFFARAWCEREFVEHGLSSSLKQCNISFSTTTGTLRGLHYQAAPYEETKLIRCVKGAIYDVIVDLRTESRTFTQYFAAYLTEENRKMLYVPEGFAHGFQTMADNTEVFYQMSQLYVQDAARGIRWDDPAFRIDWPSVPKRTMSSRDREFPNYIG